MSELSCKIISDSEVTSCLHLRELCWAKIALCEWPKAEWARGQPVSPDDKAHCLFLEFLQMVPLHLTNKKNTWVFMREGTKLLLLGGWKSDLRTLMQWAVHHFTYNTSACTGESENHPPHNAISYLSGLPGSQAPENSYKTLFGRDILPRQHQWELCQDTILQLMLKRFWSIIWRHYAVHIVLQMGIKAEILCVSSCHTSWKHLFAFHIFVPLDEMEVGGIAPLQSTVLSEVKPLRIAPVLALLYI